MYDTKSLILYVNFIVSVDTELHSQQSFIFNIIRTSSFFHKSALSAVTFHL
jgi:uncharacterized membrane protein YciS (DUF1049 family)